MSEDIHSLLGRYFQGQVSGEEEKTVENWLSESEGNRAEFRLLQKLWDGSSNPAVKVFDTDRAWQKVNASIKGSGGGRVIQFPFARVLTGIAAVLLVVLGIWWMTGNRENIQNAVASTEVRKLNLSDGTIVYLRKGSRLEYPDNFADAERRVSLEGEAFFEVSHNPQQPFIISAAGTEIKVLGTSFTVNTLHNQVDLVVKTGRVQFKGPGNSGQVIVSAGERARYAQNQVTAEPNKDINFHAWQSRQVIFERTPLEEVVATLSDYYGIQIRIREEDRQQLSGDEVTATFRDQPLSSVLNELSLITTYQIHKLDEKTYEIRIK